LGGGADGRGRLPGHHPEVPQFLGISVARDRRLHSFAGVDSTNRHWQVQRGSAMLGTAGPEDSRAEP